MPVPETALKHIRIRRPTIEEMLGAMREFGTHGWELLVLWLGQVDTTHGAALVTHAYVPDQNPVKSEDGVGYFVTGQTLFELNRNLSRTGLRLIAQVHSHPAEAFHSEADDRYAIVTAQGGLSLVVPDFGHAAPDPSSWAVFRLAGSEWLEVPERQVRALIEVIEP